MIPIRSSASNDLGTESLRAGIAPAGRAWSVASVAIPIVVTLASAVLFSIPAARPFGRWYIHENGPVEMLTFLAFLSGGLLGIVAWLHGRRGPRRLAALVAAILLVFSLGWIFAGMEEISWGQSLVGFTSPRGWERFNEQNEVNVHNLEGVQELHSFLLFALGTVGLVGGIVLRRRRFPLPVPAATLACFAIVVVLGGLDWLTDNYPFGAPADTVIGMLTEVNEMILSWAGLAFALSALRVTSAGRRP